MINHFTFNGTSTAQLGLIVSGVSIFGAGSRKVEKAGIPGRNGDLQIELGGFNNYTVRYTVSITNNFTTTAQQIREWLLESKGYCDLTDTYHPDEIRKACFNSDIEFTTSMLYKYGQASIQFDCLPERYLTTNTPITTTATADTTTDTTMSLSTVPTPIDISLNGNTTQEGSSGKNLIPRPYYQADGTYQGVTWTTDNMGKITGSGTTTAGINFRLTNNTNFTLRAGTYTLSITGTLTGIGLKVYNGSAIIREILRGTTNGHTTFTLSSAAGIRIYFNTGNTGDNVNVSAYVQLEKGSTATAYEPHISPTNPQVIHNVSGDNTVNVASFNVWDEISFVSSSRIQSQNYIPVLPNTAYYRKSPNNILVTYYNANKEQLSTGTWGTGLFTTPQNCNFIKFMVDPAYGTTYKHDICINVSDTQKNGTYEPYTAQSYPLYLPVENLLPRRTTRTTNGVTFTVNADGSISTSGTATANIYNALAVLNLPNGTYTMTGSAKGGSTSTYYMYTEPHYRGDTGNGVTFTDSITSCSIFVASGQNMDGKVFKPQIEKGSHANHYTPYGTTPIELNKIGTYQDYIYKNGGKWYVHKAITKVDLGTITTWAKSSSGNKYYTTITPLYKWASNDVMLCDSYTFDGIGDGTRGYYGANGTFRYGYNATSSSPYSEIYFTNESISTLADFKTSMSGVFLYYPIRTSTNTEITDTTLINQLNNIEKAYSYNGTTNILQVSNDNGFMLSVVSLHGSTFTSNYKGEPIITVNSTGLIYLNGEVMEVLSAPVTINCQTMQCYNGVVNMNNEVRVNDFPEIKIGANEVGSSMALTITPNNWRH